MLHTLNRIIPDDRELALLTTLSRSYTLGQHLVERSRIVLAAANSHPENQAIATELGLEQNHVGLWRHRWFEQHEAWKALAVEERPPLSQAFFISWLSDLPRSGRPQKFTAEQRVRIQQIACESPQKYGYPQTHWTIRHLTQHLIASGVVESIGTRRVWSFLKCRGYQTS